MSTQKKEPDPGEESSLPASRSGTGLTNTNRQTTKAGIDATDTAYWLYVQRHLRAPGFKMPSNDQQGMTLHLSKANVLNETAVDEFRGYYGFRGCNEAVLNEVKTKCNLHV